MIHLELTPREALLLQTAAWEKWHSMKAREKEYKSRGEEVPEGFQFGIAFLRKIQDIIQEQIS